MANACEEEGARGLREQALPNVGHQWRAQRVHCMPGLGTAEWKRGGLRRTGATEARRKARGRLSRCADEAVLSRMRQRYEAGYSETLGDPQCSARADAAPEVRRRHDE